MENLSLGTYGIIIEELDGSPSGFCVKLKVSNGSLTDNGDGSFTLTTSGGASDHGALTGLSDDDHSQYGLLAGRAGGQTLIGGSASGEGLILNSTSHATKGTISIGGTLYADEVNNRVGIGTSSPIGSIQAVLASAGEPFLLVDSVLGSVEGATTSASNRISALGHGLSPTAGDLLVITSSVNNNEGIYYVSASDATDIYIDGSFLNTPDNDIDFTIFSGGVGISKEDGSGNQYMVGGFLKYRSLFMEYGTIDSYSRPQLHLKTADSIVRIGSFQGDGDGVGNNHAGDGLIIYGSNAQGDTFDTDNFGYARIKNDRFGLYNDKDGVYAGYLFRVDLSSDEFYLKDNSGNTTFDFVRSTGALTVTGALTAPSIYVDGYIYRSTGDPNTAMYFREDRWTLYCGGRTMIDAYETTQDILYLGHDGSNDIDVSIGPSGALFVQGDTKRISFQQTGTVQLFTYEGTVNDDASFDLPDATAGMGMANFNEGAEYALFSFTDAGAVTLVSNSANVANSQSDGNYCIYDSGGTAVRIENKIGSNVNIKVFVWCN